MRFAVGVVTGTDRAAFGWARVAAVACVAAVVLARGVAQRACPVPTSLTVSGAAGAATTLRWLLVVTVVAAVVVGPALVLLYRLDTRGGLEALTDTDLRRPAAARDTPPPTV
ncbi:hypothetical protein [Streptomyces sp. TP-A0356]|uniref:hypothetical protein n=1 Tax=Streptomyces sp. TP-A0356 TaxID=1359208 RepID=UPI0018FEE47C|nr:hypothetical protein [Streptomyces sp. TP-A0356]